MGGFPYVLDDEGYLTLKLPKWGGNGQAPFIAMSEDFGDIVHGIFLELERWNKQLVQAVGDIRSLDQLIADYEEGQSSVNLGKLAYHSTNKKLSHWQQSPF